MQRLKVASGRMPTTQRDGAIGWASMSRDHQLILGLLLVLPLALMPGAAGSSYWVHIMAVLNVMIITSIGQNILIADAKLISFGQGAVMGVGAYAAALLHFHYGLDYFLLLVASLLAGILAGLLLALPALRVSGFYLGFVTIASALIFPDVINELRFMTRGVSGIGFRSDFLRTQIFSQITVMHLLVALVAAASLVLHWIFRRTRLGRNVRIAGESPEGASSLGISPARMRFAAFVVACGLSGISGGLYLGLVEYVGPSAFDASLSLFFFFTVVVGGTGNLLAPVVGVWILYLIPNVWLVGLVDYRELGYGIAALLVMLLFKDGIVGGVVSFLRRFRAQAEPRTASLASAVLAFSEADSDQGTEDGGAHADRPSSALCLSGLSKRFGSVVALDKVELDIDRGGIVGLVGPNGSGKTTLLNVVCGFVTPDTGAVEIFGADHTASKPHQRARVGLGRTFQTPRMYSSLSVVENVLVASKSAQMAARVESTLPAAINSLPLELVSHSQRRLIEVLRMLVLQSELLLLDEPAAGLSPAERIEFANTLRAIANGSNCTIILVEHDLNLVRMVADRAVVLNGGAIVADGDPSTLLDQGSIEALFLGAETHAARS